MKNIKTYEGFFKDLFKKKKELPVSITKYESQIDSFLDDIKETCPYTNYKTVEYDKNIIYSFFIKNYNKDNIEIYLEEIESACKSIGVNFKQVDDYYISNDGLEIGICDSQADLKLIILLFSIDKIENISKDSIIKNILLAEDDNIYIYDEDDEDDEGV